MIKLQLISIALSIILFYDIQWQTKLKKIFKQPLEFTKPFDCFRCNMFWIGQVVGLFMLPDFVGYLVLTCLNILTSFLISKFTEL